MSDTQKDKLEEIKREFKKAFLSNDDSLSLWAQTYGHSLIEQAEQAKEQKDYWSDKVTNETLLNGLQAKDKELTKVTHDLESFMQSSSEFEIKLEEAEKRLGEYEGLDVQHEMLVNVNAELKVRIDELSRENKRQKHWIDQDHSL